MGRIFVTIGATFGLLAVAAGAFGAHGLRDILDEQALTIWETASRYQMYHAIALLVIGYGSDRQPTKLLHLAGFAMILGILIFSGTLYLLAWTGIGWLGAITPIGGVLFMLGWFLIIVHAWRPTRHVSG